MSDQKNDKILEVKNLKVSYHTYAGEVKSVRGVSFDLKEGEAIAIVGESGCGKSVTAKSIMGLIKGPQGEIKQGSEILYHGDNILNYNKKQWQVYKGGEVAIIFQDALASLNPTMRVGKQIMENLMAHKHMTKDEAKKDRLATVLYNLVEGITIGASLLEPYMPQTAEKIVAQLNTQIRSFDDIEKFGLYPSGNKVTEKPEILFARQDVEEVVAKADEMFEQRRKEAGIPAEEAKEEEAVIDIEAKPEITFDDFGKMQFQVGEIVSCEAVPKSKKLLCSQVKIGSTTKQIVSGIRAHYTPEEMVGKKVMVLVNLKPAKLAGVLSEGMLLCAEDAEGNLALVTPEKPMPAGAEIC